MISYRNCTNESYCESIELSVDVCSKLTGEILKCNFITYQRELDECEQIADISQLCYARLTYVKDSWGDSLIEKELVNRARSFFSAHAHIDSYCSADKLDECRYYVVDNKIARISITLHI